ncbi:MAG TPA: hypothetical protein VKO42_02755 [Patescibacteria group bacterium]|nr:hypothetical protein [Patescibacteria group bacterium]
MKLNKFELNKKKYLLVGGVAMIILVFIPFYTEEIFDLENKDKGRDQLTMEDLKNDKDLGGVAKAVGGLPWEFGGTIQFYNPVCVEVEGECPNCPKCTSMLGPACGGYQEIQYIPASGSMPSVPPGTLCAPQGFTFKGGMPAPGLQLLGGGASPQLPWVVGVTSL